MGAFGDLFGAVGDIFGTLSAENQNRDAAARATDAQVEAAKNSIQWRVADAKAAGVNPVYALGSPGISISPATAFVDPQAHGSMARDLGQDLGRAIHAGKSKKERWFDASDVDASNDSATMRALTLKHADLENQLLASQIARNNQPGTGPGPGEFGLSNDPLVDAQPARPVVQGRSRGADPGGINDYSFVRDANGNLAITPSNDVNQRIQDNLPEELQWQWRNRIAPFLGVGSNQPAQPSPKEFPLPSGYYWKWFKYEQVFKPARTADLNRR